MREARAAARPPMRAQRELPLPPLRHFCLPSERHCAALRHYFICRLRMLSAEPRDIEALTPCPIWRDDFR